MTCYAQRRISRRMRGPRWRRSGIPVACFLCTITALSCEYKRPSAVGPEHQAPSSPPRDPMNHLPSFIEHSGLYNLRPDEIHADELGQLAPCVRSQDNLPKLTWKEFHAVQSLAYECLHRYGRFPGVGAKEVDKYYRYCIGDELVDRTLHIELPCPQILNPELIESFQREVLSQHALWRAAIGAQNPQDVVMIYPQVVRVGNASPKADIVKELAKVISRETSAREPHEGPRRRQLNYLRPRVVKVMRRLQDRPLVVLGGG